MNDNINNNNYCNNNINKKSYFNILDLTNLQFSDMIKNTNLFDKDKIFSYALYNSYMKIDFDSENYEAENKEYISKIIDLINENQTLKENIISKSIEAIPIQENWFKAVMSQTNLLCEKLDLINIIKMYLNQEFQNCVTKTIYRLEQNDLLEYLLFNKENSLIFERFFKKTITGIQNINIKNTIVKDRVGGNIVKKTFGYKLPHSKVLFEMIMPVFEENIRSIIQSEEEMRSVYFETDEALKNEIELELKEFNKKFDFEFLHCLKTNENFDFLFDDLLDHKVKEYFISKFLEDFMLFFKTNKLSIEDINNNHKKVLSRKNSNRDLIEIPDKNSKDEDNFNKKSVKITKNSNCRNKNEFTTDCINLLIKAEHGTNNFLIENISKFVAYLLKNVSAIQKFIELCLTFERLFADFLPSFDKILKNAKYPLNDKTQYLETINQGLYRITEAVTNFILIKLANLPDMDEEQIYEFFNELTNAKFKVIEIDFSFKLYNKSVTYLSCIDDCKSYLIQEEKRTICDFYAEYVALIEEERDAKQFNQEALNNNLLKTFNLINDTF